MVEIHPPEIEPISNTDIGELLLATARNAKYLSPELQDHIAKFAGFYSKPAMYVSPADGPALSKGQTINLKNFGAADGPYRIASMRGDSLQLEAL